VPSPSPGTGATLTGVTTSNAASNVWAVGYDTVTGASTVHTLTLNWNGSQSTTVASPNAGTGSSLLFSAATTPGAAIVHAVGYSEVYGAFNPFAPGERLGSRKNRPFAAVDDCRSRVDAAASGK
jgi:hypothetical protein